MTEKTDCAYSCGRTLRYKSGFLHSAIARHGWKNDSASIWCGYCDVAAKVRRHQARAKYQRKDRP